MKTQTPLVSCHPFEDESSLLRWVHTHHGPTMKDAFKTIINASSRRGQDINVKDLLRLIQPKQSCLSVLSRRIIRLFKYVL